MAKKVAKTAKAKDGKKQLERKSGELRAIHYYKAPDGKIVKEIEDVPEPKKLSKYGEWRRANPNGIIEILDMKAVMK
jgi:hypothetical protein